MKNDLPEVSIHHFRDLIFTNPFLPERRRLEAEILREVDSESLSGENRLSAIIARAETLESKVLAHAERKRLPERIRESAAALSLFSLFHQLLPELDSMVEGGGNQNAVNRRTYRKFMVGMERRKTVIAGAGETAWTRPEHLFACFFQLRRAFHYIHRFVIGAAEPIRKMRGRIWESIFTRDMRRFQLWMYEAVGRFPTLVLGPSGSGKELVARAIGQSRFLSYDPGSATFQNESQETFYPVNLSALSPTVIESELFGHVRGAFTGAQSDRKGLFESAGPFGTVFLDEIGEIGEDLQVKLLRLLQSGEFQRLGESASLHFGGKIIAATHRDLASAMRKGRFREDLFYRLCGDQVQTPTLRSILDDEPGDLPRFISFVCQNLFAPDASKTLTPEIHDILLRHLPPSYPWPGNFRELEQAVRNIVVTGEYLPLHREKTGEISTQFQAAHLSLAEWTTLYADQALQVHGSQRKAAEILQIDPRTFRRLLTS